MTKIKIGHYNNRNDKKSGHYVKEITKDMVRFIDLNQKMKLSDDTMGMEKNKYVNSFINELGYTHRGVWETINNKDSDNFILITETETPHVKVQTAQAVYIVLGEHTFYIDLSIPTEICFSVWPTSVTGTDDGPDHITVLDKDLNVVTSETSPSELDCAKFIVDKLGEDAKVVKKKGNE